MTRAPRPVDSFGPEILSALLQGATGTFKMHMSYKMGVRFRLRVHQLREAMRVYRHEKYSLCSRVRVSIMWDDPQEPTEKQGRHTVPIDRNAACTVTLQPNDIEFVDILNAAGVYPLAGVTHDDLPEPDNEHSISELEKMLKEL